MMRMHYIIKGLSVLFLLAALNTVNAAATEASAGKIVLLIGKASVIDAAGKPRKLKRGGTFFEGDTFETQKKSFVKLKYTDGGVMLLRPETKLVVEEFRNPEKGVGKSVFNLVKGGLRAVTGAVAKKDPSTYKLKTPVATLGVRGTDYVVRYCSGNCGDLANLGVPAPQDGLYTGVSSGGIVLTNGGGSRQYNAGQFGYATSWNTPPEQLADAPGILKVDNLPDPLASEGDDFIAGNACE
ncbi:FecR domain-containing protein [Sulfuriflexus sp.]|uniref:FecR family protein n=1 Tax=Sulfuriflexus sp. TaxID=2015443 RepID=UPI0028CEDE46|nr:FecR domain-containing protein [Sulfuriflexus sp.]MDT8405368.1 FecR domain-containing protein [Sulfuriflexus sp.]